MANNESRVLTVSSEWYPGKYSKSVPMIRLRGEWLRSFGFSVGERFQVVFSFEEGCLMLQKISK